jgi:P27 family predicted phage terminase small subunit
VPQLSELGLLTNIDTEALSRYCLLHEQFLRYADQIRRGLDVVIAKTETGRLKYAQVGPAATLLHKTLAAMLRLEQEFGLTPSARSSIDVKPAVDTNPLAKFGITG